MPHRHVELHPTAADRPTHPWPVHLLDHLTDPAPIAATLRANAAAVGWDDRLQLYVLWRRDDVRQALHSWSNATTLAPIYQPCPEALAVLTKLTVPPTTAAADDPPHRRTRRALAATFPPRPGDEDPDRPRTRLDITAAWGTIILRRVRQLVDTLATHPPGTLDVAPHLTDLPLWIILDILGVPATDAPRVKAWADGQLALVWGLPDPAEQVRLAQGLLDFWTYTRDLVVARAADGFPGDDWISAALRYRDGRDTVLTLDEVASLAFNLLVAGHETTGGLLTRTVDRLLATPGRWCHLADHPQDVPAEIEHTLAHEPPIDGWLRQTITDTTVNGITIPARSRGLLLLTADATDLPFGYGPHFCIGAALARAEATTAVQHLAAVLPGLRRAADQHTTWRPNLAFRAHAGGLRVVIP